MTDASSKWGGFPGAEPARGRERSPLMPTYPPAPVTFVRGEGSRLYDADGRAYLDFVGGWG